MLIDREDNRCWFDGLPPQVRRVFAFGAVSFNTKSETKSEEVFLKITFSNDVTETIWYNCI
jgi:hypothetical protein